MKVISTKQPWAHIIALKIKDVENRTWRTNYRGKILIHASADESLIKSPVESYLTKELMGAILEFKKKHVNSFKKYNCGAIIGAVDMVDCVINYDSIWAERSEIPTLGDVFDDLKLLGKIVKPKVTYNWVLENAVMFKKPILNVKGKLSLWDYDGEIEELKWKLKYYIAVRKWILII